MEITFLGTAAAEGYPDPFCGCDNCEGARRIGGKALRKRASVLIDDVFLIDFGPDLLPASQIHNVPLTEVEYAVQTHPHEDHLFLGNFVYRTDRCLVPDAPWLQYAVSPFVEREFKEIGQRYFREEDDPAANHFPSFRADLIVQEDWETIELGPYTVLAIPATHAPGLQARIFAIRHEDGSSFLYGTDTAPMPDGVWERVSREGWTFELLIMDHTHGTATNSSVHHSSESMVREIERMKAAGTANDSTRIIAHHFAHHSNPLPDEFERFAGERGYEPAWDGMVATV